MYGGEHILAGRPLMWMIVRLGDVERACPIVFPRRCNPYKKCACSPPWGMLRLGFEPRTSRLKVGCSAQLS